MTYRAVDALSFAGGFTLGVVQAGFELAGKRELPGGFGVPSCEANRHLLGTKWQTQVGPADEWEVVPNVDAVFGNPPCSGFSVMSAKSFRGADSKINHCMWSFADYAARTRPQIAVFESVQQAFTSASGHDLMRRLRARVEEQTGDHWDLYHIRHNAYSVGGAAQRRRYFWLISRIPFGIEQPRPTYLPVLADVIGDLATLPLTWQPQPYRAPAHPWLEPQLSSRGVVDGHTNTENPHSRRLHDLMNVVEWLPGESVASVTRRCYQRHGRLPESWAATSDKLVARDFAMGFTTPTRWRPDSHARVITGGALGQVVHPWLPRLITHREAMRVLGFPDDWVVLPIRKVSGLGLFWGKGISVQCGRWIGEWMRSALDGVPGSYRGALIGDREWDINVTHAWKHGTDRHRVRFPIMIQ